MSIVPEIVIRSNLNQPLVISILLNNGKYVLQHRDEKPGINEPGRWGLFGGYREMFETPRQAITRELREELGITVKELSIPSVFLYWSVFIADITALYHQIVLGEGQAYGSFTLDEARELNISSASISLLEAHSFGDKPLKLVVPNVHRL